MNHTIGWDPELMVRDVLTKRIVSAIPILKNDKHRPIDLKDGIKLYADNVLCELAAPPSHSGEEAVSRLRTAFTRAQERLGKRYLLHPQSYHVYDKKQLNNPMATEVGCNPNFDVYEQMARAPSAFKDGGRSGSFHIHLGHPKLAGDNMYPKEECIKLLDVYLGCASVIFDKDETSHARRALYGKAGEYRPTPYGVEARILGNYALRSPQLAKLVFDLVDFSMEHIDHDTAGDVLALMDEDSVRSAINDDNPALARAILGTAALPKHLLERVTEDYKPNFHRDWGLT